MNKTKKVIIKSFMGLVLAAGILNIVDYIYAATSANAATASLSMSAKIQSSATLVIPTSTYSLEISPLSAGNFDSATINIGAYCNSSAGYTLTMSTANTSLTSGENTIPTLDALAGGYTTTAGQSNTFPSNHWGVSINGGDIAHGSNYYPMTSSYTIINTENPSGQSPDAVTVDLGAKLDMLAASGTYTGTLNFALTANVPPIESIDDLNSLQDFNTLTSAEKTAVLASMPEYTGTNTSAFSVLSDSRDGQNYTIAKLKDGKVWMMTNLNLGDTDNYPLAVANLDSSNTNLASGVSDIPAATFTSWKKTSGTGTRTSAEYITVSGTDSVSNDPYNTLYNYCATSAGTMCNDQYSTATNATSSLCPAGWRLPTGGANSDFTALSVAYGGLETTMNSSTNPTGATMQNILRAQLKMTFAGYFGNSTPANQGSNGYYWSSTWNGATGMYILRLDATYVLPTSGSYRDSGLSIRCVLQ